MSEARETPPQGIAADFDLTRFHEAFFEEAGENLAEMETLLLSFDSAAADHELLNAIFRCAHSVKGGAATFGFNDLADLAHAMETLLDRLRRREIVLAAPMVDALLESGDLARALLARRRAHEDCDDAGTLDAASQLRLRLAGLSRVDSPADAAPKPATAVAPGGDQRTPESPAGAAGRARTLHLTIGPLTRPELANHVVELFDEIPELGTIRPLDAGVPDAGGRRSFEVRTSTSDDELLDLFGFHVARDEVVIRETSRESEARAGAQAAPTTRVPEPGHAVLASTDAAPRSSPATDASTLRVPVEKIDVLINLVGELVIGQSMLAQTARDSDSAASSAILACMADLERNTRQLQEAVMAVRMIPVATVFMRFPRLLRDLAARLGKQVELHTVGESTELDKGMIEKITDPLIHLVRNGLDHGIESPQERVERGKPPHGSITLSAAHHGGSIVIEVSDDGRGLDRDRILSKAREAGMPVHAAMSDHEVYQLLFAAGFSTVDEVTEVSGRGVGLDVVRENILALGGSVAIEPAPGCGTRVTVRLPLTLAILDGMSVAVGDEVYIVPLGAVVESFRLAHKRTRSVVGTDRVVEVRGEYVPVIALEDVFGVAADPRRSVDRILVVVESDGARVAVLVDSLVGQHQIVVKNLETNYRQVPGVSAATILGDGKVALIVDVAHLVRRSRH
ncbi:MAG: chemotaxis protein CheW [Burkholderiaceae bacterium]|nr:chemotaxis protein CheW [Burkholderiaceae bacterium]